MYQKKNINYTMDDVLGCSIHVELADEFRMANAHVYTGSLDSGYEHFNISLNLPGPCWNLSVSFFIKHTFLYNLFSRAEFRRSNAILSLVVWCAVWSSLDLEFPE